MIIPNLFDMNKIKNYNGDAYASYVPFNLSLWT